MANKVKLTSPEQIEKLREYAWLGLDDLLDLKEVHSPTHFGFFNGEEERPSTLLDTFTNPEYFWFVCKHILNIDILPFQAAILAELWVRPFPMLVASRGAGKSFILAVYTMLRLLLTPGSKVVIAGAGFRQSKIIFQYMELIWRNAPILQNMTGGGKYQGPVHDVDVWTMRVLDSFAIAIPIGDGGKIRGLRATHIIVDEFAMVPESIYENVIAGFAAVSASPVDNVKQSSRRKVDIELGLVSEDAEQQVYKGNQSILSGTAYYHFNHFAKYWERYRRFILSEGDENKLAEIFNGEVDPNFNWRDYSIIRLPYELLPEHYMDTKHVAKSKATVHSGIYAMEFGAVFTTDSNGFFKRSLIENCVVKEANPPVFPSGAAKFSAMLHGSNTRRYVLGVDPASENDNFSIIVLELWPEHRRIVYCWTATRQRHRELVKKDSSLPNDFYAFCARKIRNLMKLFPCERIALDSQGGGLAIEEALHDKDKLETGEMPIWPITDPEKPKESDDFEGLHILELVNFASAEWTAQANHGMKRDFEDKALLFPFFDALSIGLAAERDKENNLSYDTLEDCVMEIEELKDELTSIVHTQTGTAGRDRWDTPELKLPGGKKGHQRKDRYSALVMANMIGRVLMRVIVQETQFAVGGFVGTMTKPDDRPQKMFHGPDWMVRGFQDLYG